MILRAYLGFCLFMAAFVSAQDTIQGTYSYTYGDQESLVEARQTCKDLALREAVESYAVFIQASSTVENFQLKEDVIQSISSGYLKGVKIIEQLEEGRTITITVEADIDPDQVVSMVNQLSESAGAGTETKESDLSTDREKKPIAFLPVLTEMESRMQSAVYLMKSKKYYAAQMQFANIHRLLERRRPAPEPEFAWLVYQGYLNGTGMLQDLMASEQLEAQKKHRRARVEMRKVLKKADSLRKTLDKLEALENLDPKQNALRQRCMKFGREALELTRRKTMNLRR
jgi:hypothetical protein